MIKNLLLFTLIILIASIKECYSLKNITFNCRVSSPSTCSTDKVACYATCELESGLSNNELTEVSNLVVKSEQDKVKITKLKLKSQGMIENLPQKIGAKFPKLENFEVTSTDLTFIKRSDFLSMETLKELNLANNKIELVPSDTFNNLTSLEILLLYNNKIASLQLHTLDNLKYLREFHADMNKIERLGKDFFKNNKAIERISLNDNGLKSVNENFTSFPKLEFVDLRRNFEFCTACEIMEENARIKRFNDCRRDKFTEEQITKRNFTECAKTKISERDEFAKKFDACTKISEKKHKENDDTYTACSKITENPVTIQKIKDVDACIVAMVKSEADQLNNYVKCIDDEADKDKEFKDLLTQCTVKRAKEDRATKEGFDSCMYCEIIGRNDNLVRCEVRYVKDYDDDLDAFNQIVRNYFPPNL